MQTTFECENTQQKTNTWISHFLWIFLVNYRRARKKNYQIEHVMQSDCLEIRLHEKSNPSMTSFTFKNFKLISRWFRDDLQQQTKLWQIIKTIEQIIERVTNITSDVKKNSQKYINLWAY